MKHGTLTAYVDRGCRCEACRQRRAEYDREYRLRRPDVVEKRRRTAQKRQQNRRAMLDAIKVAEGCADCGYTKDPVALDFDHVKGDKVRNVGTMTDWNITKIFEEIAKCEVVCSNCHRIRTKGRGYWNQRQSTEKAISRKSVEAAERGAEISEKMMKRTG